MKRRLISFLLVICMLFTLTPYQVNATENSASQQNPFSDVNETDWFYDAVMYATQNGLFDNAEDNLFSPNALMTRALVVTVFGRIAKINPNDYKGKVYSDVPAGKSYAPYVKWATEAGITNGVGDDRFDPEGVLTREQLATMTVRFFDAFQIKYPPETVTGTPPDFDQVSDYAKDAVLKLWRCGLFKGDENGFFNPKHKTTRAEAATFCARADQLVVSHNAQKDKPPVVISGATQDDDEQPTTKKYNVTFMEGDDIIDQLPAKEGEPLEQLPGQNKIAKDGYIFTGWYADKDLTVPFYAQDPVMSDLIVYAKYERVVKEQLTLSSFAQVDQSPDLSFIIQKIDDSAVDVGDGITVLSMDGSDPVDLSIEDQGDGTYLVFATEGFNEGSSYQLTLADGYVFKDKPESIRMSSFTIKKEEVYNLKMNNGIIFIKDTENMSYTIGNSAPVPVLKSAIMNSQTNDKIIGTFEYENAGTLQPGDVLCIYEHVDPRDRDYSKQDYADDAEAYVEVISIDGLIVTFRSLDDTDADKVIFIPDTIPFSVDSLPTEDTGTVQRTAVDNDARISMGLDTDPEVETGDFVVFYEGAFANVTDDTPVYYGVVTNVNGTQISYIRTTKEEIEKSMDTFLQQPQDGDSLLENVDTNLLEEQIEQQVIDSGFAREAAEYLALMVTQTNGFQSLSGLKDFSITDENGNPLSAQSLELLGIGMNIELSDDVKVKAGLGKSSKYFTDGISLELGIFAEFTVDVGEDGELKINLAATFVEEIAVDITVSAKAKVKWYFIFPKFKQLTFGAAVDLKNYAGVSVDVKVYTVEKEEDSIWDKLKGLKNGQYKEVFEQIEELKDKIVQAKETADRINGYKEDLEALWQSIPQDVTNKDEYEGMLDTLGELNVTQELMDLMNLTTDDELDAGVRNLMDRYAEMLENESDWITIIEKEVFQKDIHISVFAIGVGATFVIKGNVNLALGANLEYVVGKRYSFWYDIISKTGGNSEIDLLDEKFAFQFYCMGELGLKMGVEAEICAGIISTKIGSIGITAEFGPYLKMWGYFIYEYTKLRPANTSTWEYDEKMMGAMYLEFGLYLEMTFKADVLSGVYTYEPTLLDKEWPLLTAGTRLNVYDFAYEIEDDESLLVKDHDNNSSNGISMALPESFRLMEYIDLCEGDVAQDVYDLSKFNVTLSNRLFTFDEQTGVITVNVPKDVQYLECDLTLTWKSDKLSFSRHDITVTIPLVWTNLAEDELNQRFTASVRAGNPNDGYVTVWSQRVKKNAPFDLPDEAQVRQLLNVDLYETVGFGNLKYAAVDGYKDVQETTDLTVLKDTVYYFDVTPRTYTLTVKDVQNSDGTRADRQYFAKFGEAFDLSDLYASGSNQDSTKNYTKFLKILAKDAMDREIIRDFSQPISEGFAMELLGSTNYSAVYADNSATVIFTFEGVDLDPVEVKVKKGSTPGLEAIMGLLNEKNALIKSISPSFAPVNAPTTYTVICEVPVGPVIMRTITYNTNGGSEIPAQTVPVGSIITRPTDPVKNGYDFKGWYQDEALTQAFIFDTMPDSDITLYGKWKGIEDLARNGV